MKNILIVGAGGQLANCFDEVQKDYDFEFIFKSEFELDLTHFDQVEQFFVKNQVDYCINCAAYTQVDKAENNWELAHKINADAVGFLAKICKEYNTKFIHISTDYVFDGEASQPYLESDETNPLGVYGASKLAGEKLALENNVETIIIRTAWVYSQYNQNFVKTMIRLMTEREEIGVVNDQFGHPTSALDLAKACMQIIQSNNWISGIYHYSNSGEISWFDFAKKIAELQRYKTKINPIETKDFPTPAKRPKYSVLNKDKITKTYAIEIKDWEISLKEILDKLYDQ
jgi:dTDP-4-dehydrorhamnose reductase